MPTLRSEFTIDQFEQVLQKFAHEQLRFLRVRTEEVEISFYYNEEGVPRRIRVGQFKRTGKGEYDYDYYGFTVEPKAYDTSSHSTKVTFDNETDRERIQNFIDKIMQGQKATPRFQLDQYSKPASNPG